MKGTRVTCEDLETGETQSVIIRDDYVVICDGRAYVDGIQAWGKSGTQQITVKKRPIEEAVTGRRGAHDGSAESDTREVVE
jgi:hypothetical protein